LLLKEYIMSFIAPYSWEEGGVIVPKSKDKDGDYTDSEITIGNFDLGQVLNQFTVDIHIAFDGTNPTITIGTDADPDKYVLTTDNYPKAANEYVIEDNIVLTADETIKAFITPDGATQGSFTASICYAD